MGSEMEEWMTNENSNDPPCTEEDINGVNSGLNDNGLKKGPWTATEDAILVEYVTKHGEGNWNNVQKHTGLARCGKSCRLRWANHLRPDLKKGAITPEEERLIIELHAKMGNKWARMAAELPGRTDNEIKNYWNTRIKRRQRAGLPIYPPEICLQALTENRQNEDFTTFSSADQHYPNSFPVTNFQISTTGFADLELNHQLFPSVFHNIPSAQMLDIPSPNLPGQGQTQNSSHHSKPLLSMVQPSKRHRGTENMFPGLSHAIGFAFPGYSQQIRQTFGSYVQDLAPRNHASSSSNLLGLVNSQPSSMFLSNYGLMNGMPRDSAPDHGPSTGFVHGGHGLTNGNHSSEPAWQTKLELPSFQNQTMNWHSPSSPLPKIEPLDIMVQLSPTEYDREQRLSQHDCGLLDTVLYESKALEQSKRNSCEQASHTPDMPVNATDSPSLDFHETEWEAYGEPISTLDHSYPVKDLYVEPPESVETITDSKAKEDAEDLFSVPYDDTADAANQMIFSRPDFLLASSCLVPSKDSTKNHAFLKDALDTFLADDLSRDCKKIDTAGTSSIQPPGHDSCTWNTMSTV